MLSLITILAVVCWLLLSAYAMYLSNCGLANKAERVIKFAIVPLSILLLLLVLYFLFFVQ